MLAGAVVHWLLFYFSLCYGSHRHLHVLTHSFPSRRSSDLFGVHFLSVYHIAFPVIAAFLMSISMLLFFSVFERRKWACLAGLMFLLLVLLSLGETHMAFGNLSLARAFHGKYVFLSTVVPAWSYFSLQFLIMRKIRDRKSTRLNSSH